MLYQEMAMLVDFRRNGSMFFGVEWLMLLDVTGRYRVVSFLWLTDARIIKYEQNLCSLKSCSEDEIYYGDINLDQVDCGVLLPEVFFSQNRRKMHKCDCN